ncbi:MAG: FtsQ-type POTRA domain-containing protein, partial [Candidatus Dormibacteraeota bacterium]|nr:FtsQ-type POTRA domain-containing protein [Candidatus Dormibacteraeota bacterium]
MSPQLEEQTSRRAQIRAIAAGLVDSPRMGRRFHVPAGVALEPSARRRRSGRPPRPRPERPHHSPLLRRAIGAAVLLLQVGVLAALFVAPTFRVHTVELSGDRLLGRDSLLSAADVPRSSLFAVDSDGIRARLAQLPWVRSVSVTTVLPATVRISVTEWQPDLVLSHLGTSSFVAANGASLAVAPADAAQVKVGPLLLDQRPGVQRSLPAGMPDLLAAIAQRWPAVFGSGVAAFQWSSGGVFSIWSSTGWEAILGDVDSTAALAAIPGQLSALAALHGRVDFASPAFGYVDMENPVEPAMGGHPGLSAALKAEIAAATTPVSMSSPSAFVGAAATGGPAVEPT